MSSPRRDRRSRSGSPNTKSKRSLDLVSTRVSPQSFKNREWQPRGRGNQRGRGRGQLRPFVRRDYHGVTVFRGTSQRYFPRHARDESGNHHHRRSRSRGRSWSREHQLRSKSASSEEGSRHKRHRSGSRERHTSSMKDRKQAHSRDSFSPEIKLSSRKKHRRHSSASPNRRQGHKTRSRSHSAEKPRPSQSRTRREERDYPKYPDPRYPEEMEDRLGRRRERSRSPEVTRGKRPPAPAAKGKELIPRNRLHKIFSLITQDTDFELDEDISIAIQRNPYAEPSEDSTVTVVFNEELFTMIYPERRKHKPIFDREEIKVFGHDKNLSDDPDFERRVIRLKPGKSSQPAEPQSSGYQYRSSFKITRTVKRGRSTSRSNSPARQTSQSDTKFRVRVTNDPRFESRFAELQGKDEAGPPRRSNLDPTDLRHELSSNRKTSVDARIRIDRDRDRREDRPRSSDARDSRPDRSKDREELPDFSRRKDKNMETPWLYDPESIPKDPKYFMHDDREHERRERGRGGRFFRGRFNMRRPFRPYRSRGYVRGGYRGRGNYFLGGNTRSFSPPRRFRKDYEKSPEREWKHDKFSELDQDGEKKPHREDDHEYPHSTSER
ncbi:serine/arginine-rich splicing factor 4-like isoform X2 [Littorina saxatilis]|uniref:Uncharacterized protein n=1 Tax=Littorina saxatilis TaxID=31220 RepID=A0AAN9G1C8_9CAEN